MKLSVVMPVRDAAPYLDACIESVLAQTFTDFEFVIRDDGSVDRSRQILRRWNAADSRIRLFESDISLGPAASSNWVVARARSELVARMDGDDIANPDRFRRQIEALAQAPEACLVGTLSVGIDPKGRRVRPRDRWPLAFPGAFAPFPHGSIMFRRAAFEQVGGYRADADFWEDLDLYRRLDTVGHLIVLPMPLYHHRASLLSTRLTSDRDQVEASIDRMHRSVLGAAPAQDEKRLPRVFVSLGSTRLWAGEPPRVFRSLLTRAALQPNKESILTLIWAAWGAVSPRSLRLFLSAVIRLRDRIVARRVPEERAYRWICEDSEMLSWQKHKVGVVAPDDRTAGPSENRSRAA